jgi:hypothetical protein
MGIIEDTTADIPAGRGLQNVRRLTKMKLQKSGITKRFLFAALCALIMAGLTCMPAMAAQEVTIQEGVYRIKAVNGNAKGLYLFYSEGSDRDKRLQFHSFLKYTDTASLRDHDMEQLWYIQKTSSNSNSYYIWTYFGYYQGYAAIKNLVKVRKPNKDTPVYCETGAENGPDYYTQFKFYRESGSDNYNNLTIRPAGFESYRLNRHKKVRALSADLIYLNANKDSDTSNKLWQLEPFQKLEVTYWDQNRKWFHSDTILLEGRWNITTYIPTLSKNEEFFGWYFDGQSTPLYQPGQEMSGRRSGCDLYADIRTVATVNTKTEAPSFTAKKNGKIGIDWTGFRRKMKKTSFWKTAKYVEIQYSTDSKFRKIGGIKKIKKGTIDKTSAKSTLSNLKKKKTYYIRVRLWDGNKRFSKWSKAIKVKTKK